MKKRTKWLLKIAAVAAVCALAAVPATAESMEAIPGGLDLWKTSGGGLTFTSFSEDPLPADFFCRGSEPFTGTVRMKGQPLAASGDLGGVDTAVRRLDDATFDAQGVARTRIQLAALSLESSEPISTRCGAYNVLVRLEGEQPTTQMKIVRASEAGGTYEAPLAMNIQVVFVPAEGNPHGMRAITRYLELGPGTHSVWARRPHPRYNAGARLDLDGDGRLETVLPPAENFAVGVSPAASSSTEPGTTEPLCQDTSCHCAELSKDPYEPNWYCEDSHLHCVDVWVSCDEPVEPVRYGTTSTDGETSGTN